MSILPNRYNTENLKKALNNPSLFFKEPWRVGKNTTNAVIQKLIMKQLFKYRYGSGISVMEQDWDNLIILDACRFFEFKQNCEISGELKQVVSKGSTSREWINKNFIGREFHDTVYTGGNPHMEKFTNEFHYVNKSYSKYQKEKLSDMAEGSVPGWHPKSVFESAIKSYKRFPNKRLIIHFMQPHDPYIGPKADQLREQIENQEDIIFKKRKEMDGEDIESENTLGDLRSAAQEGYISQEDLFEVYIENLNIVLEYVQDLLEVLGGKTIVTADHGELLGSGRFISSKYGHSNKYGHPINVYHSDLRIVPWLETDEGERRDIFAEKPIGVEEAKEDTVKKNLKALGYK